jgi:hypothetical protein
MTPNLGGQGVASSNLASPTVRHVVKAHFPGRGMYRQAVKGHRFQFISDGPGYVQFRFMLDHRASVAAYSFRRWVLASAFRENVQGTVHRARKGSDGCSRRHPLSGQRGAASTGATPARSMATARVRRTR